VGLIGVSNIEREGLIGVCHIQTYGIEGVGLIGVCHMSYRVGLICLTSLDLEVQYAPRLSLQFIHIYI
jgi:hypothetical protein